MAVELVSLGVGCVGLASLITVCHDVHKILEKDESLETDLATVAIILEQDHLRLAVWGAKNAISFYDSKETWCLRHANQQQKYVATQSLSQLNHLQQGVDMLKDRYGMRGISPMQIGPISLGLGTRKRLKLVTLDAKRLRSLVDDTHRITEGLVQIDLFEGRRRGWRTLARLGGMVRRGQSL
ncbi:uncharacterized protein KY384_005133 [Bacidia gigantensis]|uniref:uncharacterized protein n=1 Tax=Bacidia gigantensis TaxID=2732470 RepID=UPI001D038FD5|nr:uncharacterized protein KY384_005133 [Bacidia gigantensis]KAG8529652.1 hypothetical protein KY384_005133 [Bacidia gigantensis]